MNRREVAPIVVTLLFLAAWYPARSHADVPAAASAIPQSAFETIGTAGITVVGTSNPSPAVPQLQTLTPARRPAPAPSAARQPSAVTLAASPVPPGGVAGMAFTPSRNGKGIIRAGFETVQPSVVTASQSHAVSGTASTYGPGFDGWLALPAGPGHRVRVCGAGGCIVRVSNDAGPSLAMQRRGRIVDLSVADFEIVCGVPWRRGLCRVVVTP